MAPRTSSDTMLPRLIIVFSLLAIAIGFTGYEYYDFHKHELEKKTQDELASIADLKVNQIVAWRREELAEANAVFRNNFAAAGVEKFMDAPDDRRLERTVREWMGSIRRIPFYKTLILTDAHGVIRLSLGAAPEMGPHAQRLIREALKKRTAILSDFHKAKNVADYPHLDLVAPVIAGHGAGETAVAAVLIRLDPKEFLYPLIQTWPGTSRTAETLLIRREGSDIVFLNDLRYRKDTALSFRLPLGSRPALAALLDKGGSAVFKTRDYRNAPVLAVLHPVPRSPWYLISKVDVDEIYLPLRGRAYLLSIVVAVLIAAAGFSIVLWWRRKTAEEQRRYYQSELERRLLSQQYDYLSRFANDIILLLDMEGNIVEANDRAADTYGYERDELLHMNVRDIRPFNEQSDVDVQMKRVQEENGLIFEARHRRKDGSSFPVEISSRVINAEGRHFFQSIIRDITDRKLAEQKLHHITRLYAVLSQINQAIVRTRDRDRLFQEVCRIAVEYGGFRLAWIGLIDRSTGLMTPVARSGVDEGYLDAVTISAGNVHGAQVPTDSTLREGKHVIYNDILNDSRMALWREHALQRGYRSSAAFCISVHGSALGALNIYSAEPNFFHDDDIKLLDEVALDISFALENLEQEEQRRLAEASLIREKNKSEAIIAAMGDGISIQDRGYRILYQNQVHKELIGDHVGKYCYDAYEQRDELCENCPVADSFRDGAVHTAERSIQIDGKTRYIEITSSPLRDDAGATVAGIEAVRDITDRKRSEIRLAQLNDCLLSFGSDPMDNINRLVALCGEQLGASCALYNRLEGSQLRALGQWNTPPDFRPLDKAEGHICYDVIREGSGDVCVLRDLPHTAYAQSDPNVTRYGLRTYIGKAVSFGGTFVGSLCIVDQNDRVPSEDDLKYLSIIASAIGVEENRRSTLQALKESEGRFRHLIESVTDYIYTVEIQDGRPVRTYHGPGCLTVTGYTSEDYGKNPDIWIKMVYEEDRELVREQAERLAAGVPVAPFEHRIIHKDGSLRWVRNTPVLRYDSAGQLAAYDGLISDITRIKTLENQLRQAQKMEAIGQLAGGVAHDFNNILTAIIGYANLLVMKMPPADIGRTYVDQILSSAERAAHLTHSLLAFSRKQIIDLKPVDVNEIIRRVERLLLRVIGEDIEFKTMLGGAELVVQADSVQIEQVLMNLATNARDAMPDGGTLLIETEPVELGEDFIRVHSYGMPGRYALISVTDTGIGMDKSITRRIFEPFFTTKEVGRGTGLGLAMVYGIVKQHNGYINVYSEPGKGSTFKLYLPLIAASATGEEKQAREDIRGGEETILLAEDDDAVRTLSKSVLTDFGYRIIEALNGEDAVRKFKEEGDRVDLLILDIIMPRKNGKEAYEEISRIRPGVKALFMSGYTANVVHRKGILEAGLDFILKPITPTDLLKKVREVLDREQV